MVLALVVVSAASAASASAAGVQGEGPAPDSRPDIIVIYTDDVNPHDGRLWSDPERTPVLAQVFDRTATVFENAIGETPLCCPGRAGFLTGRHTSNHGVLENDIAPFDPEVTIATELDAVGYQTFFIGKYLNLLRSRVPPGQVERYAQGWDRFDVLYDDNGRWYDYDLWTRRGIYHYGRRARDHITAMTERRALRYIRGAAADAPLFAFLSIFHTHGNDLPQRRHIGDERCASIEPWSPPSFNEADVSDKPAYVRDRPPLRRSAWPMQRYCEEMLGVEAIVERLVAAQEERGRLRDTLFIFTADNGITWGAHRLGQVKGVPYATPVPLSMSWPARWGTEPRRLKELVSNIDLAPTLCQIAGCEMGPFPTGPERADGLSLLPLLDGDVADLGRDLLREQSGPDIWPPQFWAIRTTSRHRLGRWHYIEYDTGEVELYDSEADPWELENVATDPGHGAILAELAGQLRVEFEGTDYPAGAFDPRPAVTPS